jgi:hypothetical protein
MKGKANNGEYKITVPQHDLSVMVDGFKNNSGNGSWYLIAFTPAGDGAMMMGVSYLQTT